MQGGCPVIASPVGDLPLLISRYRAGLLAPAASVPGLRLALRAALDSVPTDFVAALPQARQAFDVDMIAAAFVNRLWSHQLSPQGR
jgi:glycosyltransferase involved in cell wall biosynthesis